MESPLAGRSILIVEDDAILSTDLAELLASEGCKVVLPTTSISSALSAIGHYAIDAAILDVNIQNEWVFPVAYALEKKLVPYLFLTGYSETSIPAELRERPFIQKPHLPRKLVESLARLQTPTGAKGGSPLLKASGQEVPVRSRPASARRPGLAMSMAG